MAADRLTLVESTVHEHSLTLAALRESSARVEQRLEASTSGSTAFEGLDQRFAGVDQRFDRLDQRIGGVEQRLDRVEQRLDRVEQRVDRLEQRMEAGFERIDARFERVDVRFERLEGRFDRLEDTFGRALVGIVGVQVTVMLVVVGSVVSIALTAPR